MKKEKTTLETRKQRGYCNDSFDGIVLFTRGNDEFLLGYLDTGSQLNKLLLQCGARTTYAEYQTENVLGDTSTKEYEFSV